MRVAAIPLPPHSGKDSILLLWFLRIVRGRALVVRLLLPGFLLHVGQLLQLFGRENGFNLRRRLVANLIDLCNLLLLGQRRVIARRIHLPGFICDNRAQFLSLLIRQIQRIRSEEHTSELQSQSNLVCRLLLEKKNTSCWQASCTSCRSLRVRLNSSFSSALCAPPSGRVFNRPPIPSTKASDRSVTVLPSALAD